MVGQHVIASIDSIAHDDIKLERTVSELVQERFVLRVLTLAESLLGEIRGCG